MSARLTLWGGKVNRKNICREFEPGKSTNPQNLSQDVVCFNIFVASPRACCSTTSSLTISYFAAMWYIHIYKHEVCYYSNLYSTTMIPSYPSLPMFFNVHEKYREGLVDFHNIMDVVCNYAYWYAWLLNKAYVFIVEHLMTTLLVTVSRVCNCPSSPKPCGSLKQRFVEAWNKDLITSISGAIEATRSCNSDTVGAAYSFRHKPHLGR